MLGEAGNANVIAVYAAYALIAIALTTWLARTLYRSGTAFLHDVFTDRPAPADAINRLLVVGFAMLNLGYAFLVLRGGHQLDAFDAVKLLLNRLSILLVTLAAMHFVNVFVFWRIRSHREQLELPPPIAPQAVFATPPRAPAPGPMAPPAGRHRQGSVPPPPSAQR